ncbi:MAG TPA: phage tail protein [Polyangiaceae bacterium]|nr:phage tail protein [Polyangiaceae bacterium]
MVAIKKRDPLRAFNFRIAFLQTPAQSPAPPAPQGAAAASASTSGPALPYVAGVRSVSGLSWNLSSYETWSGGNNMHPFLTPNRVSWAPITLEQGLAIDEALELWAEAGRALATGQRSADARRTLRIDVWDPVYSGGLLDSAELAHAYSYTIYNAWVSKYNALPKLDASISEVALASIEISHEGWRRTSQSSSPSS